MAFSLKDYQIIAEIGRGGFASVYRARQKSLGREVAIKRLSAPRRQDSTEIIRFRREAEAMAALTHDNILAVLDHAYQDGNYYIVMEYVEGMAFDAALSAGMPAGCSLFVLEKVAGALKYAHGEKIIHRDIKPGNILLGRNGQIKLADFGLAMFRTGIESITAPGAVLGTISFLAPEALASPKDVDAPDRHLFLRLHHVFRHCGKTSIRGRFHRRDLVPHSQRSPALRWKAGSFIPNFAT